MGHCAKSAKRVSCVRVTVAVSSKTKNSTIRVLIRLLGTSSTWVVCPKTKKQHGVPSIFELDTQMTPNDFRLIGLAVSMCNTRGHH